MVHSDYFVHSSSLIIIFARQWSRARLGSPIGEILRAVSPVGALDESFIRPSSNVVPSSPPTFIEVVLCERSMVVLLPVAKLDELLVELFVNPPSSRFPSLPPILIGDLLWAKKISANNTARIKIARFIHSPLDLICAVA